MKIKKYFPLSIAVIILVIISYMIGKVYAMDSKDILPGITVENINIGNLSQHEAKNKLADLEKQMMKRKVNFHSGDRSWSVSPQKIGFDLDVDKTLKAAMNLGHTGSIWTRWQMQKKLAASGYILPPVISFDQNKLEKGIGDLASNLEQPAINATVTVDDRNKLSIIPERYGEKVDFSKLRENLKQNLSGQETVDVDIPIIKLRPEYIVADVEKMQISGLISSYITQFKLENTNRVYNISVAASALDGIIVKPQELFSFNQVVGPRSSEAGYKSAGVIVNNELVEGLGGGVCQVSSTLYNAVLLANIEIVQRTNHSLPVSYVPIGRDATVVYGAIDFKFRNNSNRYLLVKAKVDGDQLAIKIFGNKDDKRKVLVNSKIDKVLPAKTVYQQDGSLNKGQQVVKEKGFDGSLTSAERIVYENGKKIKQEVLPRSYYKPRDHVVAVGTKEVNALDESLPLPTP